MSSRTVSRMAFRTTQLGCIGLLTLAASCKTRNFGSQAKNDESGAVDPYSTDPCKDVKRFRGKLPPALLLALGKKEDAQLNSAARRNAGTPWVDWQFLFGIDGKQIDNKFFETMKESDNPFLNWITETAGGVQKLRQQPGQLAALISLQLQRTELLKCNIFDTNGTIDDYNPGNLNANTVNKWDALQFSTRVDDLPEIAAKRDSNGNILQQDGKPVAREACSDKEKMYRTIDGTCNDPRNPLMGAKLTRFGRNVSFKAARKYDNDPDPSLIAAELLYRKNADSQTLEDKKDYRKAPFFNLIAASWIQFMTHDWFSHARKGSNDSSRDLPIGNGKTAPASLADKSKYPVSPRNKFAPPESGTFQNQVTFWWDASQIYGWDEVTSKRVRDPNDRSKLLLDSQKMLPIMKSVLQGTAGENDLNEHEMNQGLAAFTDNWWMGMALLHTAFAREHNRFVRELKKAENIANDTEGNERAFQLGRLYISALIAKIHTIEWTPQLLFNPVLESAMEANWHGLVGNRSSNPESERVLQLRTALGREINRFNSPPSNSKAGADAAHPFWRGARELADAKNPMQRNFLFALLASVPGATALNSNHFGSPFSLPEEFTTVYRLHPLIPDVLEQRKLESSTIVSYEENRYTPVLTVDTALELADKKLTKGSIGDWWVTFGTQRTGTLQLNNYPRFMKSLNVRQNKPGQQMIDLAALEIARDRERGVPKLNEFRANIGLEPLKSFDDFIDMELAYRIFKTCVNSAIKEYSEFKEQDFLVTVNARRVMESCDKPELAADKAAFEVQLAERDKLREIYKDVNRVDTLVGFLAENTRPHGYALAETQFQIFILNASRRLFSDRFLSTDFNEKTYTKFGMDQLRTRGMRDVIADNFAEEGLQNLLKDGPKGKFKIANAFDPWTRKRNNYDLDWSYNTKTLHGGLFD